MLPRAGGRWPFEAVDPPPPPSSSPSSSNPVILRPLAARVAERSSVSDANDDTRRQAAYLRPYVQRAEHKQDSSADCGFAARYAEMLSWLRVSEHEALARFTRVLFSDHSIYYGETARGKRHGRGMYMWPSGDRYAGTWRDGEMDGTGKMVWSCGVWYAGAWLDGEMTGFGRKVFEDGAEALGYFVRGVPDGMCRVHDANGVVVDGRFSGGKAHGRATKTWPDGTTFKGTFRHGEAWHGQKTWTDGTVFEGYFVNDELHGYGVMTFGPSGGRYEGAHHNGAPHGYGVRTYSSGTFYEGMWIHGRRHGMGSVVYVDGSVFQGSWFAGQKHGPARVSDGHCTVRQQWSHNRMLSAEQTVAIPTQCMRTGPYAADEMYRAQLAEVRRDERRIESDIQRVRREMREIEAAALAPARIDAVSVPATAPRASCEDHKAVRSTTDENKCKVCFESEMEMVLDPCGHICMCRTCAEAVDECPICRTWIQKVLRFYRA